MRLFLLLLFFTTGFAAQGAAAETYDLLFRKGSLSSLNASPPAADGQQGKDTLVYDKLTSGLKKGDSPDTDSIGLQLTTDDNVTLILHRGPQMRSLGNFPASVGNPLIMYFLESALDDVAKQSGGSPFYIRNRIKDALRRDAEVVPVAVRFGDRDVQAQQVTLRPFEKDKARDKMGRFADLALAITVSEDVPGGYYSLKATVPEGKGDADIGYVNTITLKGLGEVKP